MSYRITWNFPALRVFYDLTPHTAMIVDRAVIRFAERGEGEIEHDPPHHLLRTGVYDAILAIDEGARALCVLRLYRARR